MKKLILLFAMVFIAGFAFSQTVGSAPDVENVTMQQSGRWVTVSYDLSYDEVAQPESFVSLLISDDAGATFRVFPKLDFLEGDVGSGVVAGTGKVIRWHIYRQFTEFGTQGIQGQDFRARVIARREGSDGPGGSSELVTIDGTEGTTFNPGGLGYFNPGDVFAGGQNYNVSLRSFQMGRHLVTQAEYEAVMSNNPSWFRDTPNLPVEQISWWSTIEYCNRRSIQEGLTPCYSYLTYGTNPDDWPSDWNSAWQEPANVSSNWNADGYRLPTEMEWEFAARGGASAQNVDTFNTTYAGSNNIDDVAWYSNNSGNTTHPVGSKAPNEFGLYDMSGNLNEWCWDFYEINYPSGAVENPSGPPNGSWRVFRSGAWNTGASGCDVSLRNSAAVTNTNRNRGFRLVRSIIN